MAKLADETLTAIFTLQRQLVEGIYEAAATESTIFAGFGETELTLPVLEQLVNVRERLMGPYSRLSALLPRIAAISTDCACRCARFTLPDYRASANCPRSFSSKRYRSQKGF